MEPYKQWLKYLEGEPNSQYLVFFKFSILWFSFESYLNEKYHNARSVVKKLNSFKDANKDFYNTLLEGDSEFEKILLEFSNTKTGAGKREYVQDMKKGNENKRAYFREAEIKYFRKFIDVIYQIRCNFFHGGKFLDSEENKRLVQWAYNSFSYFWSHFVEGGVLEE